MCFFAGLPHELPCNRFKQSQLNFVWEGIISNISFPLLNAIWSIKDRNDLDVAELTSKTSLLCLISVNTLLYLSASFNQQHPAVTIDMLPPLQKLRNFGLLYEFDKKVIFARFDSYIFLIFAFSTKCYNEIYTSSIFSCDAASSIDFG